MTWLFVRFYLCVLVVLFLAWYIHGKVSEQRWIAERGRVYETAHAGGARLIARELNSAQEGERKEVLTKLRKKFEHPIRLVPVDDLPSHVQNRLRRGDDVIHYVPKDERDVVIASLSDSKHVIRLGPFPNLNFLPIEKAISGWMRLTADKLNANEANSEATLMDLRGKFEFPVTIIRSEELPAWPKSRFESGVDVVFYWSDRKADRDKSTPENELPAYSAAKLAREDLVLRCGPFPNFERVEEKAATMTLAFVLLPAALAIALLLRPVAQQLRRVEETAQAIATGDLEARVNEQLVTGATRPLAQAFNNMASRTETLVRTQRELLQAVSHELRTPLARMRFAIELIESAQDDEERQERLASLDASTTELDRLVGELLMYVRMESSDPPVELETVDVQPTLEELLHEYSSNTSHLTFDCKGEGLSQQILVDRVSFRRAIGNLLNNAIRHAKSHVQIRVERHEDRLAIDVVDDGLGIEAKDRERVFEPFVRLDTQVNNNGNGVGLGLAIVQRIMKLHDGSVEIQAETSGGCTFRTTWPIA